MSEVPLYGAEAPRRGRALVFATFHQMILHARVVEGVNSFNTAHARF